MRWIITAGLLLAACGQQAPQNGTAAPTGVSVPEETAAAPAPSPHPRAETKAPSQDGPVTRDCRLQVDGKTHVEGRCLVFPGGDGGYTLNAWSQGKPRQSHFAVVVPLADGTVDASWNADPDDDRAGDPLGKVRMEDGCWVNQRARICAR